MVLVTSRGYKSHLKNEKFTLHRIWHLWAMAVQAKFSAHMSDFFWSSNHTRQPILVAGGLGASAKSPEIIVTHF